jgi:hypothetical protein
MISNRDRRRPHRKKILRIHRRDAKIAERFFSLSDFLRGEIRQNNLPLSGKGKLEDIRISLVDQDAIGINRTKITLRGALWVEVNLPLRDLPQEKDTLRSLRVCGE